MKKKRGMYFLFCLF